MIVSFLDNEEAIGLYQNTKETGRNTSMFTQDDWDFAKVIKEILAPIKQATVELSGDIYVSGSKGIIMTKNLLRTYAEKLKALDRAGPLTFKTTFCKEVHKNLYNRLRAMEWVDPLAIATLTNPRYKRFVLSPCTGRHVR